MRKNGIEEERPYVGKLADDVHSIGHRLPGDLPEPAA
jgi:hypothetical protein